MKSELSQLFFLDPEWLCCLMAQIVTITEVNPLIDKQGVSSTALWKSLSLPPSLPPSIPPSLPPPLSLIMFSLVLSPVSSLCDSLHPAASGPLSLSLIFSKSQSFPLSSCRSTFVYWRDLRWFSLRPRTRYSYIPSPLPKRKLPSILLPPASPDVR